MPISAVKPVERKRLFESVIEQIHDLILAGHLKAGDTLPPQRELCQIFQVSRTSIRSAIQALEALGLVKPINGKATQIKKAVPEEVGGVLSVVLLHDIGDVAQLYECRRFLESWVAYYAASRLSEEQLQHLERLTEMRKREIIAGGVGCEQDFEFHWHLAKYCGNEAVARLVYALLNVVFRILNPERTRIPDQSVEVAQHDGILEALKARDGFRAMQQMWYHLTSQPDQSQEFPPFPFCR